MKKIKYTRNIIALFIFSLVFMGRLDAQQGVKGVDCNSGPGSTPVIKIIKINNPDACRFEIKVNYSITNPNNAPLSTFTTPFNMPHGILIEVINGGYINWIGSGTVSSGVNWFNTGTTKIPNTITPNLKKICWIKQTKCGVQTSSDPAFKNMIPQTVTLTIPINITPTWNNSGTITIKASILRGDAWPFDVNNAFPSCNQSSTNPSPPSLNNIDPYIDCFQYKSFTDPLTYKIVCDGGNATICSLCPPATPADAVLKLVPSPPPGSRIEWFKYTGTCPSAPSATDVPFSVITNFNAQNATCPTGGPLNQQTCWLARIITPCFSYISQPSTIEVCKPIGGCPITAVPVSPYPVLTKINNEWHTCFEWKGNLKINDFGCKTTVTWKKRVGTGPWTTLLTCTYTPSNPCGLTIPTGILQGPPVNGPCFNKYEYRVDYTNACGSNSCVFEIYVDRKTQIGTIKADPLLIGWGNINGPVFCTPGYTNLKYYQSVGACEKVVKWQISENTDPCGVGNNWTTWQDIQGSSNGATPTWATNLLYKTTRYRVIVQAFACDAIPSNPIIVKILPPLSVTLTANSLCPDICNPPVILTANVPCSNAYNGITYRWYKNSLTNLVATTQVPTFSPTQAGLYFVEITSNPDCGTVQSNKICVCDKPKVSISGPCGICKDETATLVANISGTGCTCQHYTYLWSTGETTSSITVNSSGNYSVTVTNGLCTATGTFNLQDCPPSQVP